MLKALAILGMWLLCTGIMAGQPNKAPDPNQQITQPKPNHPATGQTAPEKHNEPAAHEPETGSDPPEWYAPLKRPEWWLVIVGFGTLGVVGWQTKILGISVKAAQTAADAAEMSAVAAMGVTVPVLVLHRFEFTNGGNPAAFFRSPRIRMELWNYGKSPAFLKEYAIWFSWEDSVIKPIMYPFNSEEVVRPNDKFVFNEEHFGVLGVLPEAVISDLVGEKQHLTFSAKIVYRSVFTFEPPPLEFSKRLLEYDPDPQKMLVTDVENPTDTKKQDK
ncbi:MAG TPA: hypothetical protein VME86_15400 [Acidobacteriaceae bacterium]|nr:hypothetical protein [Acidobacteriaceae bacterium]